MFCFIRSLCVNININNYSSPTATSLNQMLIQSCLLYCKRLMTAFPDSSLCLPDSLVHSANIFQVIFFPKIQCSLYCSITWNCPSLFIFYRNSTYPLLIIPYFSATKLPFSYFLTPHHYGISHLSSMVVFICSVPSTHLPHRLKFYPWTMDRVWCGLSFALCNLM